ncbi:transcriptional regulator KorA (plasmid) [Xylella fastidiosa subsp. pauca]|uniref:transcriptional regulator KorA n=1 Tax=Xylella fastidiosa TaxID=2371 RepID=UPI00241F898D|nr:transcriptional regulator KorA [Xylella fastidiosa]MDG5826874.1 transcriptional regulator KorA [Xylella fastidiosa subsp. pauca]MDG5826910.1 transcriptional regulator KorA [Xylella fastidiosa subsp. pauca]
MRSKKRLTAQEFETLRPYLSRLKERNVEAIRQILVEGRQQTDVADELGVTKKAVSQMVGKAWQAHIEHGERPAGWISISVTLPPDMAELVKDMERKARANLTKG